MAGYRAYIIDLNDHIESVRLIEADTDEQAREAAKQFVNGLDVELWCGQKKIAHLSGKK